MKATVVGPPEVTRITFARISGTGRLGSRLRIVGNVTDSVLPTFAVPPISTASA